MTAISGTTLTLRTEAGTETVDTTATTKFTKEMQSVSLSAVKVGDIVHVAAPRPNATSTVAPGTGTVTATRVEIVEPTLTGRVTNVTGAQISLVGPDGQTLSVSTTPATKYYSGPTAALASTVKVDSYIVAEGSQDSLTHLTADVIRVREAPGAMPAGRMGSPGSRGDWGPRPAAPSA
ncbi:DUF5666 domain-containing protein [Acidiferrimicrobium sp. IK]|uniref:DUF5666 domain-containing protein n=1 Tax=Acidiferrimicrobium sp. IK TaxID=2871700 RepID=UPI0021CB995C|nr:DUF5666 domain-containing protein [Acidiferrimicrobium sp. IK]MCU4186156.1 DUF5666 domain-containing protein [Acidiferrimicrobium sp. IK]